jgi:hypothetical protein
MEVSPNKAPNIRLLTIKPRKAINLMNRPFAIVKLVAFSIQSSIQLDNEKKFLLPKKDKNKFNL